MNSERRHNESVLREAISKPEGPIMSTDLQSLASLNAYKREIVNIEGLQYCSRMASLDLGQNDVVDISPLASMKALTKLSLLNRIDDISALSSLRNLTDLLVQDNQISDISPITDLPSLKTIWMRNNPLNEQPQALAEQMKHRGIEGIESPVVDMSGDGASKRGIEWVSAHSKSAQPIYLVLCQSYYLGHHRSDLLVYHHVGIIVVRSTHQVDYHELGAVLLCAEGHACRGIDHQ